MGTDVIFNKEKAIAAGAKVATSYLGTADEIVLAEMNLQACTDDTRRQWCREQLDFLKSTEEVVQFPFYGYVVNYSTLHQFDGETVMSVRANAWGYLHKPLLDWLDLHGIEYVLCS